MCSYLFIFLKKMFHDMYTAYFIAKGELRTIPPVSRWFCQNHF